MSRQMKLVRSSLLGVALLGILGGATLTACKKQSTPTPAKVNTQNGPGAVPINHPSVDLPPVSRSPRRLSVDQLIASVQVVASDDGSITWNQDKATIERTLGKPDYIIVTDEDLTPSTLYMKFVDDLAHDVCNKMVAAPTASQVLMKYVANTDTLESNPTTVKQNMRYLYLRFFGRKVADTDDTTIQPLLTVFDSVTNAKSTLPDGGSGSSALGPVEGWRAVCVAAFTSPDFHIY
jgi:hypothetical protein